MPGFEFGQPTCVQVAIATASAVRTRKPSGLHDGGRRAVQVAEDPGVRAVHLELRVERLRRSRRRAERSDVRKYLHIYNLNQNQNVYMMKTAMREPCRHPGARRNRTASRE